MGWKDTVLKEISRFPILGEPFPHSGQPGGGGRLDCGFWQRESLLQATAPCQCLMNDIERLGNDAISELVASLRKRGVSQAVIEQTTEDTENTEKKAGNGKWRVVSRRLQALGSSLTLGIEMGLGLPSFLPASCLLLPQT